jgi:hypothetical protein
MRSRTMWTINATDHTVTVWRYDALPNTAAMEDVECTLNESDLEEIQRSIALTYPPEREDRNA